MPNPDEWSGAQPPPGYEPPQPPRRVDRVPDQADISDVEHRYPSMRAKTEALPEDEWDGMCDLDFEMAPSTSDEDIAALVLFADTQFDDPEAVEARRAEWVDLFAAKGGKG